MSNIEMTGNTTIYCEVVSCIWAGADGVCHRNAIRMDENGKCEDGKVERE